MVREDIQQVSTDRSCAHHLSADHKRPSSTESNERQFFLQSLAVQHHCCDSESTRDVRTPEAVLGAVFPIVGLDVRVCKEIIEKMAEELAGNATDDRCEVEEGCMGVVQEVRRWANELCYGGNDANGPGEENEDKHACPGDELKHYCEGKGSYKGTVVEA